MTQTLLVTTTKQQQEKNCKRNVTATLPEISHIRKCSMTVNWMYGMGFKKL